MDSQTRESPETATRGAPSAAYPDLPERDQLRRGSWLGRTRDARPEASWVRAQVVLDCILLGLAALSTVAATQAAGVTPVPVVWLIVYPALVLAFFRVRGLYSPRIRLPALDDLRAVAAGTAIAAMLVVTLRAVLHDEPDLAAQEIRQWLLALVYLSAGRIGLSLVQRQALKGGLWVRPTLIIGAGRVGHLIAKRLLEHPESGLRPIGFLDKEPLEVPRARNRPGYRFSEPAGISSARSLSAASDT